MPGGTTGWDYRADLGGDCRQHGESQLAAAKVYPVASRHRRCDGSGITCGPAEIRVSERGWIEGSTPGIGTLQFRYRPGCYRHVTSQLESIVESKTR